jgi:hypothetical protein
MSDDRHGAERKATILSFAAHVGRASKTGPEEVARRRNWLDGSGAVTAEGDELIRALDEQAATRTVFRGNF